MKKRNYWLLFIFTFTFVVSLTISGIFNTVVSNIAVIPAILVLTGIIAIGVIFDIIGVAVASSDETPFHSKASKNHKGAKEAIYLIRHTEKVTSICNDVIGDICGIVSGSISAMIALKLGSIINPIIATLLISATVSGITVLSKAIGKIYAFNNSTNVIYFVGGLMERFSYNKKSR